MPKLILKFIETEDLPKPEIDKLIALAERMADIAAEDGVLDVYLELEHKAGLQPLSLN